MKKQIKDIIIDPVQLASIIEVVENKQISREDAINILIPIYKNFDVNIALDELIDELEIRIVAMDINEVAKNIKEFLFNDTDSIQKYQSGNKKIFNFLMGNTVKFLKDKGINMDLDTIKEILNKELSEWK